MNKINPIWSKSTIQSQNTIQKIQKINESKATSIAIQNLSCLCIRDKSTPENSCILKEINFHRIMQDFIALWWNITTGGETREHGIYGRICGE